MSNQEGGEEEVLTKKVKKKPLIEKAVYQAMLQYFQNKYPKCFTIKPSRCRQVNDNRLILYLNIRFQAARIVREASSQMALA